MAQPKNKMYKNNIEEIIDKYTKINYSFNKNDPWIQTYSGIRFTPTNPNSDAIVIQDISHSLSLQCRFSGHSKSFYSVAQHSVLVSYECDPGEELWGLLHDASEAYLVDIPKPLKASGKFDAYLEFEKNMMKAICNRFGLDVQEPSSVKKADYKLLCTEARDLLVEPRKDGFDLFESLPYTIVPLSPKEAEKEFLKRFFELIGFPEAYSYIQLRGII